MGNRLKVKQIDGDVGSGIYQCAIADGVFSTAIGGVSSQNAADLKEKTISQVLDELLFPYKAPGMDFTVGGSGSASLEIGQALSSTLQFQWTTQPNSGNAQDNVVTVTDVNETDVLFSAQPKTGSNSYTYSPAIIKVAADFQPAGNPAGSAVASAPSYSWTVSGLDTRNLAYGDTVTKTWFWKRYHGTNNSSTVNEPLIEGLANSTLTNSVSGSYVFTGGGYFYFAWPATAGFPSKLLTSANFDLAMATSAEGFNESKNGINYKIVSVTNQYSQTVNYKVYRSQNILNAGDTITVS